MAHVQPQQVGRREPWELPAVVFLGSMTRAQAIGICAFLTAKGVGQILKEIDPFLVGVPPVTPCGGAEGFLKHMVEQ